MQKLGANRTVETVLKKQVEIEQEEKNFLNFDSFISSLDFKIFEACFNLLAIKKPNKPKNSKAICWESHWHFKGFNLLDTELRTLLRNEPVPLNTICEQLKRVKIDSKRCEPNQSPSHDVKERKQNKNSRRRIHAQ